MWARWQNGKRTLQQRTCGKLHQDAAHGPDVAGEAPAQAQDDLRRPAHAQAPRYTLPATSHTGLPLTLHATPPANSHADLSFKLQLSTLLALLKGALSAVPHSGQAHVPSWGETCRQGKCGNNEGLGQQGGHHERCCRPPVVSGGHDGGVVLVVEGGAAKVDDLDIAAPRQAPPAPRATTTSRRSEGLHGCQTTKLSRCQRRHEATVRVASHPPARQSSPKLPLWHLITSLPHSTPGERP